MSETPVGKIPTDAKIIVGVEESEATGWYSLHLHDVLYAISIRPDEKVVVIAEGPGRRRLRHLRVPFKNIYRFEAVKDPFGDDFLMVRLLIKHSARTDFVSIHDIGATPPPPLVPQLIALSKSTFGDDKIALKSADDCVTLMRDVASWVLKVNARVKDAEVTAPAESKPPSRQALQRIYDDLDRSEPDVLQTLVGAYVVVALTIALRSALRAVRFVKIRSCFPLNLTRDKAASDPPPYSTLEQLYAVCERYQKETNRPIEEAYEVICEHIRDLKERPKMKFGEELVFLKNNAPRSIDIIDPIRWINKKHRVLDGPEVRHEDKLRKVFENEEVSIEYLEGLPFLSLLVQYDTEDGKSRYAVVIKKDAHPALQDFLLSHEMGHLFRHIYDDFDCGAETRSEKLDLFLRSSADEDNFLEHEANDFGMAVLFPPAYLADREMFQGTLSTDELLEEFLLGSGKPEAGPKLREQMRSRIGEHIEKYKKFKDDKAPTFLTLEVKSIEEEKIDSLLTLIDDRAEPFYWIRLDKESNIIQVSNNSVSLFGRSEEEIKAAKPVDLVVPQERERMRLRAKYREENKTAIYYFTEVENQEKQISRQVIVYSFPILKYDEDGEDDEYVGAIAALKPLDEMETEVSFSVGEDSASVGEDSAPGPSTPFGEIPSVM